MNWLLGGIALGGPTLGGFGGAARRRLAWSTVRRALRHPRVAAVPETEMKSSAPVLAPSVTTAETPAKPAKAPLDDAPTQFLGRIITEDPVPMPAAIGEELAAEVEDLLGRWRPAMAVQEEPWIGRGLAARSHLKCPRCGRLLRGLLDACTKPACIKADNDEEHMINLGSDL